MVPNCGCFERQLREIQEKERQDRELKETNKNRADGNDQYYPDDDEKPSGKEYDKSSKKDGIKDILDSTDEGIIIEIDLADFYPEEEIPEKQLCPICHREGCQNLNCLSKIQENKPTYPQTRFPTFQPTRFPNYQETKFPTYQENKFSARQEKKRKVTAAPKIDLPIRPVRKDRKYEQKERVKPDINERSDDGIKLIRKSCDSCSKTGCKTECYKKRMLIKDVTDDDK